MRGSRARRLLATARGVLTRVHAGLERPRFLGLDAGRAYFFLPGHARLRDRRARISDGTRDVLARPMPAPYPAINLLADGHLEEGLGDWRLAAVAPSIAVGQDLSRDWQLAHGHTGYVGESAEGAPPGEHRAARRLACGPVPVVAGRSYVLAVHIGLHRCEGALHIGWLDGAGRPLGEAVLAIAPGRPGGRWLGHYDRVVLRAEAPAGARLAEVALAKGPTLEGTDSFLFFARPSFYAGTDERLVPVLSLPTGGPALADLLAEGRGRPVAFDLSEFSDRARPVEVSLDWPGGAGRASTTLVLPPAPRADVLVDPVDGLRVAGTALARADGEIVPLLLDLEIDLLWCARAFADRPSPRGSCAFDIALPARHCDGERHAVALRDAESGALLWEAEAALKPYAAADLDEPAFPCRPARLERPALSEERAVAAKAAPDISAILVGPGTDEERAATVARLEGAASLTEVEEEGAALAAALAEAPTDLVAILAPGCIPLEGWQGELRDALRRFPEAGLVAAATVAPHGRVVSRGLGRDAKGRLSPRAFEASRFDPALRAVAPVDGVRPGLVLARRAELASWLAPHAKKSGEALWRAVGDEARRSGASLLCVPLAEVLRTRPMAVAEGPRAPACAASGPACLVLDHDVPRPDADAGSYAIAQEMRLLQALGFRVRLATARMAYRGRYTDELERAGIGTVHRPFAESLEAYVEEHAAAFDLVYIHRLGTARAVVPLVRRHAPKARIAFNCADLHFLREAREAAVLGDAARAAAAETLRAEELALMGEVDVVLTYSTAERDALLASGAPLPPVALTPWVLEPAARPPAPGGRDGLAFVGSFAHEPNRSAIAFFTGKILPRLRERRPNLVLYLYGAGSDGALSGEPVEGVRAMGWQADLGSALAARRLLVAPLVSGAGVKGKVLDAMARGLPQVVSPLAAEGIPFTAGHEAIVAESVEEWIGAVDRLMEDDAAWSAMSEAALAFARGRHAFAPAVEAMAAALAAGGLALGPDSRQNAFYEARGGRAGAPGLPAREEGQA
ncbi:MAG: glycosyltransferase [Alphaproteobacteria bacterium]|nr:glycosyltransferase [Alphaproteobacteria bacterium]